MYIISTWFRWKYVKQKIKLVLWRTQSSQWSCWCLRSWPSWFLPGRAPLGRTISSRWSSSDLSLSQRPATTSPDPTFQCWWLWFWVWLPCSTFFGGDNWNSSKQGRSRKHVPKRIFILHLMLRYAASLSSSASCKWAYMSCGHGLQLHWELANW